MVYLAWKKSPKPVMIGEIAGAYDIPRQFLAKITQVLVKHKLLKTVRGRKGGVMLARPAGEIYLPQIIQAIDGPPSQKVTCLFGLDVCSDQYPCSLHHHWKTIQEKIQQMLNSETLDNLTEELPNSNKASVIFHTLRP